MRKYLISENGNFYKANLHCHSNHSDGKLTPAEIKELYKKSGYSVVAYTDHDIMIPHHKELSDSEFIALNGFEMEINDPKRSEFSSIKTCHICFIGIDPDNVTQPMWHREGDKYYLFGNAPKYMNDVTFDENEPDYVREYSHEKISEAMRIGREKGFFITYNHPTWSLENYGDYMGYHGMHAMEIYNGGCNAMGWNEYNDHAYDDMLRGGERIYCIGADDNHNHGNPESKKYDTGWAWTMIKANSLDYKEITQALLNGNFYASEGPEIKELWYEDGKVHVECSDAERITLNADMRYACSVHCEGKELVSADLPVNPKCRYFRLTVIGKDGKRADTNAYFVDELN